MPDRYPPLADYALLGDCHSVALVSRAGSVDWCCMPRIDRGSCFGRLLDWERGGYCSITPTDEIVDVDRTYLDGTMVLATSFHTAGAEIRVLDCFAMRGGGPADPHRQLLRTIEVERGSAELEVTVAPRFDYGELRPWLKRTGQHAHCAIGGDDGLVISSDFDLEPARDHELQGVLTLHAGERARLSIVAMAPEKIELEAPDLAEPDELDRRLERTIRFWRGWSRKTRFDGSDQVAVQRSALVLKALTHAPTGAIAAAPTTSLPEVMGGNCNWDYRFSWIRDAVFSVRSLAELGHDAEADGFRRFVERSAAGHAEDLQPAYGLGGERRLTELELDHLEGYRESRPVRIGNAAGQQFQLDAYGDVLNQAWRWFRRGHEPDDDHWRFLHDIVDLVAARWQEPDRGFWEVRDKPLHFVLSKVMCWLALDRGLKLAEACMRKAPVQRWRRARKAIREAVYADGCDGRRGIFVRAFGSSDLDAALLLLPVTGFVDFDDPVMVRTTDAIREELGDDGLVRRYPAGGQCRDEGAFVACSFWLSECYARQGRSEDARQVFDRAYATANDLGLFAEEFDTSRNEMVGNFPQGLSHLSHIAAAIALAGGDPPD